MKKLLLATLLCGSVAQLGGCIIVGDDGNDDPPPPPPPPPDAMVEPIPSALVVSWTLLGGEPDADGVQSEVTCPPNAVDVVVWADPDPAVTGDESMFPYDCVAGETMVEEVDPAVYDVWIEVLDAGGVLVAQSNIQEGVIVDAEELVELTFEFSVDRGRFALTWTILENGVPSTCENVGATDVSLLVTVADNMEQSDDFLLDCAAGQGVSDPLLLEEYVALAYLINTGLDPDDPADDDILGESLPRTDLILEYGNDFVDLGNFTFDILD